MDVTAAVNIDSALLGTILTGVAGYGLWLGRILRRLDRKLERLQHHCQACRREVAAQLAGRLPYDPEHTALWEALHYHGHPPRTFSGDDVRIIGG
jgi:hypothetical protein